MSEFTLVKTTDRKLAEGEAMVISTLLFGQYIDGCGEEDKKAWKKFWARLKNLGAGEVVKVDFKFMRNGKYHRKFFAMLNFAFDAWEPDRQSKTYKGMPVAKNFERFRKDITVQAGFYEQTFDLDGRMKLEAQSISFASMDDVEFERVYSAVLDVILQKVLITYKDRDELDAVIEEAMRFI